MDPRSPRESRTMGDVRAGLPFSEVALKPLKADPLPDDGRPDAHLPS